MVLRSASIQRFYTKQQKMTNVTIEFVIFVDGRNYFRNTGFSFVNFGIFRA